MKLFLEQLSRWRVKKAKIIYSWSKGLVRPLKKRKLVVPGTSEEGGVQKSEMKLLLEEVRSEIVKKRSEVDPGTKGREGIKKVKCSCLLK